MSVKSPTRSRKGGNERKCQKLHHGAEEQRKQRHFRRVVDQPPNILAVGKPDVHVKEIFSSRAPRITAVKTKKKSMHHAHNNNHTSPSKYTTVSYNERHSEIRTRRWHNKIKAKRRVSGVAHTKKDLCDSHLLF